MFNHEGKNKFYQYIFAFDESICKIAKLTVFLHKLF